MISKPATFPYFSGNHTGLFPTEMQWYRANKKEKQNVECRIEDPNPVGSEIISLFGSGQNASIVSFPTYNYIL